MKAESGQGVQIVFTVNGPGEVAGWLHPLAAALRARLPGVRIVVALLPCVFSSGAEASVVTRLGIADAVLPVRESMALILRGRRPAAVGEGRTALVFHLGGEAALSLLLARRLGAPVEGYVEVPSPAMRLFRRLWYSGLVAPRGWWRDGPVVGELMVDAAAARRAGAPARVPGRRVVALFPGSRRFIAAPALTYIAYLVDRIAPRWPQVDWVLARSHFIDAACLPDLPLMPADGRWPASPLSFVADEGEGAFVTGGGHRIGVLPGSEALAMAELALTIPGTSTGEIAAAGVPMVVMLPTYTNGTVPLPGIGGYIDRVPVLGPWLKRRIGLAYLRGRPFLALPNLRAGRRLVPEIVGEGIEDAIVAAIEDLLRSDTRQMSAELRAAMGASGAAARLAEAIVAGLPADAGPR